MGINLSDNDETEEVIEYDELINSFKCLLTYFLGEKLSNYNYLTIDGDGSIGLFKHMPVWDSENDMWTASEESVKDIDSVDEVYDEYLEVGSLSKLSCYEDIKNRHFLFDL
jgi:hypothetical protein